MSTGPSTRETNSCNPTHRIRLHDNDAAATQKLATRWRTTPSAVNATDAPTSYRRITLDMDSSVSPTHGTQEGSAWNGHFGCMCYHPLFVFNQFGHLERCALRPGNAHSADGWEEVLKPVIARYTDRHLMRFFRADAAFAIPGLYKILEAEGYSYAIHLRANRVLQGRIWLIRR